MPFKHLDPSEYTLAMTGKVLNTYEETRKYGQMSSRIS